VARRRPAQWQQFDAPALLEGFGLDRFRHDRFGVWGRRCCGGFSGYPALPCRTESSYQATAHHQCKGKAMDDGTYE
jgi:hypothetical protein